MPFTRSAGSATTTPTPADSAAAASSAIGNGTPMFVIGVEPGLVALAAGGASLVGILSALLPARRAAQLDPVVAIRG